MRSVCKIIGYDRCMFVAWEVDNEITPMYGCLEHTWKIFEPEACILPWGNIFVYHTK